MRAAGRTTGRHTRTQVLAIAFDLIAVAGLCLLAIGACFRGAALGLILLGGAAGTAVLPGAILSGLVLRGVARRRGWPRGRLTVTVAGLCAAALLVGPAVLRLSWNATPNPAAAAAAPLEQEIRAAGGTSLCTNGDAGRGPDNFSPWHESYFTVPADAATLHRLTQEARTAGFTDPERVANRASSFPDSQRFRLRASTPSIPRPELDLELSPTGTQLNCDPDYGRTYRAAEGQVVVDVICTIDPAAPDPAESS